MSQNNTQKRILAFDSGFNLIAMFSSYYAASKATGVCHQMISKACSGDIVSAKRLYWREADIQNFIFDCDDLGRLNLLDFDAQFEDNRKIYATKRMKKNDIILESDYKYRKQIQKNDNN